jgi:hypothetical protein
MFGWKSLQQNLPHCWSPQLQPRLQPPVIMWREKKLNFLQGQCIKRKIYTNNAQPKFRGTPDFLVGEITRKHGKRHRGRKMKWTIYQIAL